MTELPDFADRLLAWWDRHGRHDLPWQHPRTPYRVWVSEIMLQQTQVATVIPYFENFMQRFPSLPELAEAPLDDVLSAWSGLGYYARARNLHRTAIICVADHQGKLPATAAALAELPGIGESTANAIISQALDIPATVLDGNVRRVLSRHAAVDGWSGQAPVWRRLWRLAEARLPNQRAADYTQAIMDLGATLCTRSRPACGSCPVSDDCQALLRDSVGKYPSARPRVKVQERKLCMLILTRPNGDVLLEQRPPTGIWGGLWCLPAGTTPEQLAQAHGLSAGSFKPLEPLQHRLTHRLMNIQPVRCHAEPAPRAVECNRTQRWFDAQAWPQLGLPRPALKLLQRYLTGETR